MIALNEFRRNVSGFSDLLNCVAFVRDDVLLNKDGSLTAAWRYRGRDVETATAASAAATSSLVNSALARFGSGWMIQVDAMRDSVTVEASQGRFPDRTTRLIDDARRKQFSDGVNGFESSYFMSLTYLAPVDGEERSLNFIFGGRDSEQVVPATRALATFDEATAAFESLLAQPLRLHRLGRCTGESYQCSEVLSYLHRCITGSRIALRQPSLPMYLDCLLGSADFCGGVKPRIGGRHIRPVSVVGFPSHSHPDMLNFLHNSPLAYRWSTRFIFLDPVVAERCIAAYERRWFGRRKSLRSLVVEQAGGGPGAVNAFADAMASDAQAALAEASSGVVKFGFYTSVVIAMDEDPAMADATARSITKGLNDAGFAARIEDVNAVEAYLGTIPGHSYPNVRRPLLHTLNLADLLPLTSVWAGPATNGNPYYPPGSPTLAFTRTTGRSPFRLSLHVGDVGHTLVLGPTGSGKSTLLGFLMAQHFRYESAQVFAFDRGRSAFVLCNAAGGDYHELSADLAGGGLCPLGRVDVASERLWAADWLETVLETLGVDVRPHHRVAVKRAIDLVADNPRRTLSDHVGSLQDAELREALSILTLDGPMSTLLDSDNDCLGSGDFQVFELEQLMGLGKKFVVPVITYLFHHVERRLNGRPTLVVLDEAWLYLDNPLFEQKIRDWLKTLRKANAAVVFSTQSPSDILSSRIGSAIIESCPTKIVLPNPDVRSETVAQAYLSVGLTPVQLDLVARAQPKRHYFYTSPLGDRLFELELDGVALAFLGAGGKDDIRKAREFQSIHGELWPAVWLDARGQHDAARAWVEYSPSSP